MQWSRMWMILMALLLFLSGVSEAQTPDSTELPESGDTVVSRNPNTFTSNLYYEFMGLGLFFGSVNYEMVFPLQKNDRVFMALRFGLGAYVSPFPVGEASVLIGKSPNYFDAGLGTQLFPGGGYMMAHAGYRYQKPKGVLFKLTPMVFHDPFEEGSGRLRFWPAFSIGYSF